MIKEQDYLSWSQYSLWTKSKREFWKRYGLGEDRSDNKYFVKGRELGDALEHGDDGEDSSDALLSTVLAIIPKLDIMEHKLQVQLKNGSKILSYLDSCDIAGEEFYEYKSGKNPWTQELVDEHGQLLFYALSLYIKNGRKQVPSCKLIWIETEQTEEGLKYTGLVETFDREFTIQEVELFEEELIRSINEIEDWTYDELELDDELVDRYIELDAMIKSAQAEIELIRLDIMCRLDADEVDYASATNGKFSRVKRNNWVYSDELNKIQADFKKNVAAAQKAEQKNKIATISVSTSLRFSLNKTK